MQISLSRRRILVDGRPRLILAGEIHYFRLKRQDWSSRLRLLAEAGANTVASYIPWVVHEQADGTVDMRGEVRDELDLGAFIDLCAEHNLYFLARPGPFVMAELRHEGIPERLVQQYPNIRPVGWDGVAAPSSTVDYLAPEFLAEADYWYQHVGSILRPRMAGAGGPTIAVQLDNEVGMLAWVTNSPDLTDHLLADFRRFLDTRATLAAYPSEAREDFAAFASLIRSPTSHFAATLRTDLAGFMRDRFARYIAHLRDSAQRNGFGTEPLLINIHGTEAGSALSFPIGVSQLMQTYRGIPGMTSGSDHYIGTLTWPGAAELHLVHAFMDAVHGADQPLTSLEFEAGTGDYGGDGGYSADPSSVELKTRILLAQGTRLFNWYLFSGGTNFVDPRPGDSGTHRFGITGERHGAAAPVTPEGLPGPAYPSTAQAINAARSHQAWAADWAAETDNLFVGFVPDHYATEYVYRGNSVMPKLVSDLTSFRGAGPRGMLPRVLIGAGFRYRALDLQSPLPDEAQGSVIALGSPSLMAADVQQRLVEHVTAGGGLFLFGTLPQRDLEGNGCRILADAIGVTSVTKPEPAQFLSVTGAGWAADRPETRVGYLDSLQGNGVPLLADAVSGDACALHLPLGAGSVTIIAADYAAEPRFFRQIIAELGCTPGLTHDNPGPGVFAGTTITPDGDHFLHVVNVSGYSQTLTPALDGKPLFDGHPVVLAPRSGRIMAIDVAIGTRRLSSTAEIIDYSSASLSVRIAQPQNHLRLGGRLVELPSTGTFTLGL